MRAFILKILYPITKAAGKIHAPFTHKKVTGYHYFDLQSTIEPGDILLAHTEGEFTNWLIPGFWKHAAVYIGGGTIVEAVGDGVRENHLVGFMLSKDFVSVFRPLFMNNDEKSIMCYFAKIQVGKPYDYYLKSGIEAFYCAELPWFSIKAGLEPKETPFKMRPRYGELTVVPQDYCKAADKFQRVWSSRNRPLRRPK